MKNFIVVSLFAVLLVVPIAPAQAATYYNTSSTADLVAQLEQLIAMLRAQQQSQYQYQYYYYTPKPTTTYWPYSYTHGSANIIGNPRPHGSGGSSNNDDEPDVTTDEAEDVEDTSAQLQGEVDMNDFNNGRVFFVYGEDEDLVEEIEDEYDQYSDIDEEGDDLQVALVDGDLDDDASYYFDIYGLDDDTDYYFQICVEYEDEDDDDTISCGGVESFTTDD